MSGLGGVGGAGHDLISSCSSLSYSGDDLDADFPICAETEGGKLGFESIKRLMVKTGHFNFSMV